VDKNLRMVMKTSRSFSNKPDKINPFPEDLNERILHLKIADQKMDSVGSGNFSLFHVCTSIKQIP